MPRRRDRGTGAPPAVTASEGLDVATMTLGASFTATMVGLALVNVLAAVSDALFTPEHPALVVTSAVTAVVLALLAAAHHRRHRGGRALIRLVGVAAVVATASIAVHAAVLDDPAFVMFLMITLVAAGALLPEVRWLLAADATAVLGVAVGAVLRRDDPEWFSPLVWLTFGVVLAHVLQRHARRGHHQLQVLTTAMARAARHDPLTGLLNRQGLREALDRLLPAGGPRCEPGRGVAVLCFDVDGFKVVNDELGHGAGDLVLVEIADRLGELAGDQAVVARLGGDEFAVVLPDAEPARAHRIAQRARLRVRGTAGVLELAWSVSVGLAHAETTDAAAVRELFHRADLAMYQDKRAHRARAASVPGAPQPATTTSTPTTR